MAASKAIALAWPHDACSLEIRAEFFNAFSLSHIRGKTQCEVIAQVSDALEAVQKAEQLQPDLILLDLGIPKLNGMEVARRLRDMRELPSVDVSKPTPDDVKTAALLLLRGKSSDETCLYGRIGIRHERPL